MGMGAGRNRIPFTTNDHIEFAPEESGASQWVRFGAGAFTSAESNRKG